MEHSGIKHSGIKQIESPTSPPEDRAEHPQPVAVVTGGNRGIGYEICRQLGRAGMTVVLGARSEERGQRAERALVAEGHDVRYFKLDVTDAEQVTGTIDEVAKSFGRLDVLINNAAVAIDRRATTLDVDMDVLDRTLKTNFYGPILLCRACVPHMRQRGYGRIVNVSSGRGSFTKLASGGPGYRISKTALNAFTKILADEVAGSGILVNAMTPGWVHTRLGGLKAPRSVDQGADTAVWLATLPDDGPHGGFFRDREVFPW